MTATGRQPARSTDAAARCFAQEQGDLMVCARCGLEWPAVAAAPGCEPITYERMYLAMLDVVALYERSYRIVSDLKADGAAADPARARRRLSEVETVLRLVERVGASRAIKAALRESGAS